MTRSEILDAIDAHVAAPSPITAAGNLADIAASLRLLLLTVLETWE